VTVPAVSPVDYETVRTTLRKFAAVELDDGKEYLVEARLGPLAKREGLAGIAELAMRLRNGAQVELGQRVVEAMTIHETSFFRDWKPFEALRTKFLPELIAARQAERKLVIWSAACSSGQEPYTLAMLFCEYFPQLTNWDIQIHASDISNDILKRAQTGKYSQLEVNRGLPAPLLLKHFGRSGMDFVASDRLQRMISWHQLNLAQAWSPIPKPDIIFMRNVLIYFGESTKREIIERIARFIRPDGSLFLGAGETTVNLSTAFERLAVDGAGSYRLVGANGRKK